MSDTGTQTSTPQPAGFWKPRHAVIAAGVVLLLVMAVRSCGDDADEDQDVKQGAAENAPRQAIVVQIPASRWPEQGVPTAPPPAYQAPAYGQPQVQVQPVLPSDPDNPWAVPSPQAQPQGRGQQATRQWGQPQRPQTSYLQSPGSARYRPLDESRREAPKQSVPAPVQSRPAAPYDQPAGSSFGNSASGYGYYPYPGGGWPGYYGGAPAPYPVPGVYGGWPAPVYPGVGVPAPWAW